MKVGHEIRNVGIPAYRVARSRFSSVLVLFLTLPALTFGFAMPLLAAAASPVDVWWPTQGAHVTGVQPFKAMISGLDVSQYDMYWQVDGGALVQMQNNYTSYQHKEASVDLTAWTWKGQGPYTVTFVAKQGGTVIAEQSEQIYNDGAPASVVPAPTPQTTSAATVSLPTISIQSSSQNQIQAWWPQSGATLSGVTTFKGVVSNLSVDQYQLFWQVDGGSLVPMQNNSNGGAHKEADVDVSGWHWQAAGQYTITLVAKDMSGNQIGTFSIPVNINVPSGSTAQAIMQTSASTINNVMMPSVSGDPISGLRLYVDPNSNAARQAVQWQSSNPSGASAMQTLAAEPTALWFGDWNSNIQNDVHTAVSAAASQGAVPVLVAYNIPERDCGGYSSGGASSASAYNSWISSFASGISGNKAVVILEPDALAEMSCLSGSDQQQRLQLLSSAVSTLKNAGAIVYIDAGHSGWVDASTMASRLQSAGISQASGFALNVSNFNYSSDEENYGSQLSSLLGGKHFVVDTSRNGNGGNGQWCNPSGRAIGTKPTTITDSSEVDAYLWIKTPGESDGSCNGGPSAGVWWPDYALQLVQNAR